MRNSSLVKWFCADNVAGLKRTAELWQQHAMLAPGTGVAGVLLAGGAPCTRKPEELLVIVWE